MKQRSHRAELYALLPWLIVIATVAAVAGTALALRQVKTQIVTYAGESLTLAATAMADHLDLVLFERATDAQELAGTLEPSMRDPIALAKSLRVWQQSHPAFLWIGVTDATGRTLAATDQENTGQDRSQEPWFQTLKQRDSVFVEDARPSKTADGVLAISLAAPIRSTDERFVGAVTARMELPALETMFGRTLHGFQAEPGIAGQVQWQLVTSDGRVLFNSSEGKPREDNLIQLAQPSALLLASVEPPGYVEEELVPRHTKVVTGFARTEGGGRVAGSRWGVLVHLDRHDILKPVHSLQWKIGLGGAAAGAPLVILLLWTSVRLRKEWAGLLEREARLVSTLAGTADAVIVVDGQGHISSLNRAAQTLIGWTQNDAMGKRLDQLVSFRKVKSLKPADSPLAMTPGDGAGTAISPFILVGRDDRQLIVEGSIARIGDKAGTLLVLRDVTERIRSERRRDAQYAVTKVLAECSTMDEAAPHLLKAICESLDWSVGILWTMDEGTNQLLPVEFWHSEADTVPAFGTGRRRPNFSPGVGLPGEVWAGKKPVWLSDVSRDARFPEAQQASKELLHGAFAFPIMSKEKVLGVMEFFSHEVRQPDHDLLQMFSSIGTQIGHVLERRQLERQVREVRDQ